MLKKRIVCYNLNGVKHGERKKSKHIFGNSLTQIQIPILPVRIFRKIVTESLSSNKCYMLTDFVSKMLHFT